MNKRYYFMICLYYITIALCLLGAVVALFAVYSVDTKDPNYLALLAFAIALVSVIIATTEKIDAAKQEVKLDKIHFETQEILKRIETLVESIDKNQQTQNDRLNNIEDELKVYQEKLSSTNLLSILINRKKWE